jgi:hypothetical protein
MSLPRVYADFNAIEYPPGAAHAEPGRVGSPLPTPIRNADAFGLVGTGCLALLVAQTMFGMRTTKVPHETAYFCENARLSPSPANAAAKLRRIQFCTRFEFTTKLRNACARSPYATNTANVIAMNTPLNKSI